MTGTHTPTAFDAVNAWLRTSAARRYAATELQRHGIRLPERDVLDDVTSSIWKRLHLGVDATDIVNVPAYCRTAIRRHVIGLVRGEIGERKRRQRLEARFHEDDEIAAPIVQSVDTTVADSLRAAVEATAGPIPTVTSAALTYLTLSQFPAIDIADAPAPKAGARPDQARMWPALWFAGLRDGLFPNGDRHDAAQRQRLSRAARKVADALNRAAAESSMNGHRP